MIEVVTVKSLIPMPWERRTGILNGGYLRRLQRWRDVRFPSEPESESERLRLEFEREMSRRLDDAILNGS